MNSPYGMSMKDDYSDCYSEPWWLWYFCGTCHTTKDLVEYQPDCYICPKCKAKYDAEYTKQ